MISEQYPVPTSLTAIEQLKSEPLPEKGDPLFGEPLLGKVQPGGRAAALKVLRSFLNDRSAKYRGSLSRPDPAQHACSRLSSHITYGTLSMREIFQACWAAKKTPQMELAL